MADQSFKTTWYFYTLQKDIFRTADEECIYM